MYDVVEAAHLLDVHPDRVVRWSTATSSRPALVAPSLAPLFSFRDLISLLVVSKLRARGIGAPVIAGGIRTLADRLQTERPLARQELRDNLATAGRDFFARLSSAEEWEDVGRGGQRAFQEVVEPALRHVEYGDDRFAAVWRPSRGIWLNPRVQAGAACIERTRVPTATILRIAEAGDDPEDIAEDYELDVADVLAALRFERHQLAS